MKELRKNSILSVYFNIFRIIVIIFMIFIGICIYILNVGISGNNKVNWSSWPVTFTTNFYKDISFSDGMPQLTDCAVEKLNKYNLSFQMIDKDGDVILAYNELEGMPEHYSPIEMTQLYKTGGTNDNYTMFVGSTNNDEEEWAYIIGFPAKISKVTFYFNYKNYTNVKFIILIVFLAALSSILFYGILVNKTLLKIISAIQN
ncbi:MAG: sensor histidine kinase, partial [Clostridium sp.]